MFQPVRVQARVGAGKLQEFTLEIERNAIFTGLLIKIRANKKKMSSNYFNWLEF